MEIVKKYNGFSFLELIITIAIMGIMGGVGFASLQSSKSTTRLVTAQREVATTIRLAQSYALQGRMQGGQTPCGYGFRFTDTSKYEIFYKLPNSGKDCSDTNFTSFNQMENLQLGNNVVLSSPAVSADTEIYFAIPFGNVLGKDGLTLVGDQLIVLQYPAGTGATKSVTISSTGNIVEN
ncbi:MAG: prepilin-type N-terminal cleavage/methylation domain-containing protein [Candidatus Moranbacteria bacterium]|nr:prepilin-type N-terminal cleavage/methylation domain-containing protein [Candidatus Moranbacteria bacterium]